jgi:hypothetical protein
MVALAVLLSSLGPACGAGEGQSLDDPLMRAATGFVDLLAAGKPAQAAAGFDDTMRKALPEQKLREIWTALQAQAGAFRRRTGVRIEAQGAYRAVFVTCEFERAVLEAKVVYDANGLIAGLFFVAPQPSPPPVAPGESEGRGSRAVQVKVGPRALGGTLLLPEGAGPFPGLVLVHGSGPHDRDETIGPNRPFRDLALGLAAQGVAVLRYDKRTWGTPGGPGGAAPPATFEDEVVIDALAAVRLLLGDDRVDPRRVFVLGHSLGGIALPGLAEREPAIAGLILAATPSRALEDTIVDQLSYLAAIDGAVSEEEERQIAGVRQQVSRLKDPALLGRSAPSDLPLGLSRDYWLDLKRASAAALAARWDRPVLVIQGGRDYQVTSEDFEGWRKALARHPDARFRLYPDLNHLFMPGEGRGTPSEYAQPGHVATAVIEDLAAWIRERRAAGGGSVSGPDPGR